MSDQIVRMETEINFFHNPVQSKHGEKSENVEDLLRSWNLPEVLVQKILELNITVEDLKDMQPTDLDFMFPQDEAHLKAKLNFRRELLKWKYKTVSSQLSPEGSHVPLDEILQSSQKGCEILMECKSTENTFLTGETQRKLVACIAEYFQERKIIPSLQQLSALADDIEQKFPGESKEVFFEPQGLLCRKIKAINHHQESEDDEMEELEYDDKEGVGDVELKETLSGWNLSDPVLVYRKLRGKKITLDHLPLLENSNIDQIFRKEVRENVEFKRELAKWKNSLEVKQKINMEVETKENQDLMNQLMKFDLTYPDIVYKRLIEYKIEVQHLHLMQETDLCDLFPASFPFGIRSRMELRPELKNFVEESKKQDQECENSCETENNNLNSRQRSRSLPTLNEILQDCATGVTLYTKRHQALEDDDKRELVQIIVQYVVQNEFNMNQARFHYFASEIQRVFPHERKEHYYRHLSDGRQSGRLYNKYRNDGRRLRRILQRTNNRI